MNKTRILNLDLLNIPMNEFLDVMKEGVLVTPNVDIIAQAQHDRELYEVLDNSEYQVCDSRVIALAYRLLFFKKLHVIPGSSFFSHFYMYHKDNNDIRIFLLGALGDIAERAREQINSRTGREIVVDALSPSMGFVNKEEENEEILKRIDESGATVLLIGAGCPRDQQWIKKYSHRLSNVKLFMALGATIDFEAGAKKRAPAWMQKLCIEWLYRLLQEPGRLAKRYLIKDPPFFWKLFKQRLGIYKNPFDNN